MENERERSGGQTFQSNWIDAIFLEGCRVQDDGEHLMRSFL